MNKSSAFLYAFSLFVLAVSFSPQQASAIGTKTVQRGSPVTLNWNVQNASNCQASTVYPQASDGISSSWSGSKVGSGSVTWNPIVVGAYTFGCSYTDPNTGAQASDSATLVVADCTTGSTWDASSNSCLGSSGTCVNGVGPYVSPQPYDDAWCQARGYAYSTNTCLGYCAGTACSPNQGSSCTSSANSCGQTNSGTIKCDGSCSATTPSDASCPVCTEPNGPYDNAWCQARGYSYSTNTCLGYCAGGGTLGCTDPAATNYNPAATVDNNTCTYIGVNGVCDNSAIGACSSGTLSFGPVQTGNTYSWRCAGSGGGSSSGWCSYTQASSLPTATLSANPGSVSSGGRSTLLWSSTNATSCTAGGPWSNSGTLSGSGLTDPLSANTTFTFQCFNASGASPVRSATVAVLGSCVLNQGAACASAPNSCGQTNAGTILCNGSCSAGAPSSASCPVLPTASLSANPLTIDRGQASKLTWNSTNATSCTAAGGFATGGATSNSTGVSVSPSTTSVYQITCSGPTGTSAPATATVTVLEPSASISAAPARLKTGQSTAISWSASGVTSCAVSGPGVSSAAKSGSQSVVITSQSTYTITCQTNGAPLTQSVTINVEPDFKEF